MAASGSATPPAIISSSSVPTMTSQSPRRGREVGTHLIRGDEPLLAGAMARETPEVRSIVDVEHDFAAMRLGVAHGELLRRGRPGLREMRSRHHDGRRTRDIGFVDVGFVERAVGTIVAIEDQRELLRIADAEQDQRGQAFGIGVDAGGIDALPVELLSDEATHMFIADPGDETALQSESGRADRDVGGAAPDRLGKARHVFETATHLGAVEVDRGATDSDDVELRRRGHEDKPAV